MFPSKGFYTSVCLALIVVPAHARVVSGSTLQFPSDRSHGIVSVCEFGKRTRFFAIHDRVIGAARGDVTIPDNEWVMVHLTVVDEAERNVLRSLPPLGIRGLRVSKGRLDHRSLDAIARRKSLEYLDLRGCSIDANGFKDLAGLPELQGLELNAELDLSGTRELANWISRCPKLESWTAMPSNGLAPGDWARLAGHPSLGFVSMIVDQHAVAKLKSIQKLPRLHGINLRLVSSHDEHFTSELAQLGSVQWINWTGGAIGKEDAVAISEMKGLRSLVLQGQVRLDSQFPDHVRKFQQLERLVFNTSNTDFDETRLTTALATLPNLRHWPRIMRLDSESLAAFQDRDDLRTLEIREIASDVDVVELKSMLGRQSLVSLGLSDDRTLGLEFLEGQDELEEMRLRIPLSKSDFSVIKTLPRLKSLHLQLREPPDAGWAELSGCRSLENLEIRGELFASRQVEGLKDIKPLRSLSLPGLYYDDEIIAAICKIRLLSRLRLGSNSMVSDLGLSDLANKKSLTSLSIGGTPSESSFTGLKNLPGLIHLFVSCTWSETESASTFNNRFHDHTFVSLRPFSPDRGSWIVGKDGFLRVDRKSMVTQPHKLEGLPAPRLSGNTLTDPTKEVDLAKLHGKVVLIDFWGTWCGPCLTMHPHLERLRSTYEEAGLVILGVHSETQLESASEYLRGQSTQWLNIGDRQGIDARAYGVDSWPMLYLIGRRGVLRVADLHIIGAEDAIKRLIVE